MSLKTFVTIYVTITLFSFCSCEDTSTEEPADEGCSFDFDPFLDSEDFLGIEDSRTNIKDLLTEGFSMVDQKMKHKDAELKKYENTLEKPMTWVKSVKRPKTSTTKIASCQGFGILETSKLIAKRQNFTKDNVFNALTSIAVPRDVLNELNEKCQKNNFGDDFETIPEDKPSGDCLKELYRSASGSCNNPHHFCWGSAQQPFQRLLPADYEDGLDIPRGSSYLPNPRAVSKSLSEREEPPKSKRVTQMLKLWGQFLDHDVIKTPEVSAGLDDKGKTVDLPCCEKGNFDDVDFEDCTPIEIPEGDAFFNEKNISCLRFVRALPFSGGSLLHPREQLSEASAFIDGSTVYGSSLEEQKKLRELSGGLLKIGKGNETTCTSTCPLNYLVESDNPDGNNHFMAGDDRVNEQPSLASMHTIWLRLHNIVADLIHKRTSSDDEIVFQEARRIIAAMIQHVTYTEFLPVVLGPRFLQQNGLSTPSVADLDADGYDTKYDPYLNADLFNAFGAAAFRFGHTLVTNDMAGKEPFKLERNFFNGKLLRNSSTHPSSILENEFLTKAEGVDALLNKVLTTKVLAKKPFEHGLDLMSLNIMRGRDHGIPSYNEWRLQCRLSPFFDFEEMKEELDPVVVDKFASLYESVDDVDLFPAGLAEKPTADGILGPTFSCLLLKQFTHLKHGDRFWYENGPRTHVYNTEVPFTPKQLSLLRKTSLAYVLCLTTSIEKVSPKPMVVPGCGGQNNVIDCKDVVATDYLQEIIDEKWKPT